MRRTTRTGLIDAFDRVTMSVPLHKSGVYLGNVDATLTDWLRVEQVAAKYVKGLIFYVTGRRLSPEYDVVAFCCDRHNHKALSSLDMRLMSLEERVVGEGVFGYRYEVNPDDENNFIWLLRFYESYCFQCLTLKQVDADELNGKKLFKYRLSPLYDFFLK